jgi:hypothetical protein
MLNLSTSTSMTSHRAALSAAVAALVLAGCATATGASSPGARAACAREAGRDVEAADSAASASLGTREEPIAKQKGVDVVAHMAVHAFRHRHACAAGRLPAPLPMDSARGNAPASPAS